MTAATPQAEEGIKIQEPDADLKLIEQKRVAPHTHIKGLGLNESGVPIPVAAGFVGQVDAREAAGIVVELVRMKRMAGRAVLIAGPPGTGKTAIALAISQELGPKVPFHPMVGTEVYSSEVGKTAVIQEGIRKAIGVRVKEVKEVYEGEITELRAHEVSNPYGSSYDGSKTISHVSLTLRSTKGTKQLKLDATVYENILRAQCRIGDVVYIESNSGAVKRIGRADTYKHEYDLETEEYVPIPKGEVHKKKEVIQEVTLHDLDVANSRPTPTKDSDILSLVTNLLPKKRTPMTDKLREEVNHAVDAYIKAGVAELVPGVLFIDEAHTMDHQCYAYLHKIIESSVSPIIVMATNKPHGPVKGSPGLEGPFCMPEDLLDRLLLVKTTPYTRDEMSTIISIRAKTEAIKLSEDALQRLATVGVEHTLRYPLLLLIPANALAEAYGHAQVEVSDLEEAMELFKDPLAEIKDMQVE